jgi:hypothetical protein
LNVETKADMWPILDTQTRQTLNFFQPLLQEHLRRLPIDDFGIVLAMYGHSRATAHPRFIVLSSFSKSTLKTPLQYWRLVQPTDHTPDFLLDGIRQFFKTGLSRVSLRDRYK